MTRKKILFLPVFALLIAASLVLLPILSGSTAFAPFCPLAKANAQDNPCLVQEATISAMKADLLQATLDNLNYQATITALQSGAANSGGGVASTQVPVAGLPFTETFDDNSRGWALTADEDGSETLSQGQLLLTAKVDHGRWLTIPNVHNDEFFLEVSVTPQRGCDQEGFVGFALNNSSDEKKGYHILQVGRSDQYTDWEITLRTSDGENDVTSPGILYKSHHEEFLKLGKIFLLGFEAKNGQYILYIDNTLVWSGQITPYGPNVGFWIAAARCDYSVLFDNLTVRQTR